MEPIHALKRMRGWSTHAEQPPGPERISVFLTNKCNLNCRHCWRKWADWDRSFASEVSDERWLRLVDEAADMNIRHWIFLGGGEPLVRHKLVMKMLEKMAAYNMTSWIHTNGVLFNPDMIERLMDKNILKIIFSIDGPDAAINDYIRGGGFDAAVANLRYFAACKRRLGVSMPSLHIYATITNLTWDKLDKYVDLAASIDPDVKVFLSSLIVEEEETAKLALTAEQQAAFPEKLRQGILRAEELGIETNFSRFLDVELIEDTSNMQRNLRLTSRRGLSGAMCYEPWLSAAILADGSLGPCCAFYDAQALSIRNHTMEEAWLGGYMQQVRDSMFDGKMPHYCVRCPANLFADKEELRIFLAEYLRRDQEGVSKRLLGILGRTKNTIREEGLWGLGKRFREWLQLRMR